MGHNTKRLCGCIIRKNLLFRSKLKRKGGKKIQRKGMYYLYIMAWKILSDFPKGSEAVYDRGSH